ncbi:MAG: hypothetical protein ACI4WS_03010 [Oscillospiraceae bacterium]
MKTCYLKKVLPLLLSAAMLTGCAGSSQTERADSAITAEAVVTSAHSSEADEPEMSDEQSLKKEPAAVSPECFTTDAGNGLREFSLPAGYDYPANKVKDGLMLTNCYNNDSVTIILTDLSTGETSSAYIPIDPETLAEHYIMIVNGYPVVIEANGKTMTVYDRKMKPLRTESLEFRPYYCTSSGSTILMSDNSEKNSIVLAEISQDGSAAFTTIPVELPEGIVMSMIQGRVRENEYLISCYDQVTYQMYYEVLNTDTGELIQLDAEESKTVYTSGERLIISEYGSDEVVVFDPKHPDMTKTLNTPAGTDVAPLYDGTDALYFYGTTSPEKGKTHLDLYRYDPDSCDLTARFEADFDTEYLFISGAYEYGGYVILDTVCADNNRLFLWQPEDIPAQRGYNAVSGTDYSSANHELAQNILEKYSINVNYGSDGVRHFEDYAVVAETDEKLINNALNTLDGFFSKFPSGFFEEINSKTAYYDSIKVYLNGKIIPNLNESQSISDAAAFVTTEYDQQIMVIDITQTYALEKNLAHEFMHIIENAMYDMSYDENGNWRDNETFQRWEMLNPADFSYYYSYTDDYGFTLGYDAEKYNGAYYYEGCGTDVNTIFFVDGYSMTFPKEDRARIFENIATTAADKLPDYFRSSAMQLKAAYLCACIRDSFDCITGGTSLFWENGIDQQYNIDFFRANYDIDAYLGEYAVG